MRHQKSSLLSLLFMCLAAMVLAAGCGGSGSSSTLYIPGGGGSSSGGTSKYAEVVFSFPDFAASDAKMLKSVPDGTRFISFFGSNSKGDALYGPVEYKGADKVSLPDVPVTTTVFFLQFRDSKHEILNLYATDKLTLKSGETTVVTVDDFENKQHAPKSMAVTAESESLAAGYATQCAAKITYGNGAAEVATELVDWKSSAKSSATVNNSDSKGLVKAIAPGSANITAEIADLKGTVAITVTDAVLESLEITTPDPFILMLATYQFKAQATFSDGTAKDVTNEVTWSSDNTEIAEIDENGLALAVKNGQANITATSANGQADTTTLSISDIADVREISIKRIDNDSKSTPLGFTASYQAIAKVSSEMRDYDVTDQVTWKTENDATGAFSNATPGLYETMGCATGDTVISCVLEENEVESKNTLDLAVTDAKITGLTVLGSLEDGDVENPYILSNRENIQFAVKADLSDGTTMMIEPSADLAWTVEPADAVADENGLVTPAEAGAQFTPEQYYSVKATYNYTYEPTGETETLEAETTLNVADALQVNEVTVEAVEPAGAAEVPVGHTVKYKATAKISTMDLTFNVTDQVTWSDVSAVGTMNAGLFTAETAGGPVDVIATLTLADIGGTEHEVASEAAQITVTDAILESIAIDQNAPQIINNNDEFVFTATATYSDGSTVTLDPENLPEGASITWTSAETSIAEIDETTGAVTPKADTFGQTEITVTYSEGEVTADASTMLSTYDSMAVTEVTIDTVPAGVTECANGYTVQFQATAKIGTKDMKIDVTRQVEWNNDEIAAIGSIDENGVFTATATGNADIKATLTLADYGDVEKTLESDPITFTVTDAVLKSIVITSTDGVTDFGDKAPQILNNNMDLVFTATGVFSDGTEQVLSSADGLAWESSVRTIAAIDPETGAVTPDTTAWGQTEITAAATNSEGEEISASTMLSTADAMSVTALELTVDNDLTTCARGYTAQFRVIATVGTEGMTFDVTGQSVFENVDAIGEIDEHGLFTGTTVGTASIKATYTAADYSGTEINTESNAIDFEVTDAVLESIIITSTDGMTDFGKDAPQILNNNENLLFTATGHFSYGDDQELTDVTWESSNTDIAEIDASGAVTPVSTAWGQTEITVTSGDISASVMLSTVDAMSVTELLLSVDNDQTTCAQGYTAQFRAHAVIGTEGMTFDVTDQVTFDGIDAIGDIDEHGLFTGTTVGTASIKATYTAADYSGTAIDVESNEVSFEVTDAVLESIIITSTDGVTDFGESAPQILNNNENLLFTATGHFSYGDDQELTDVTWESSNTDIAEIDASGAVTPVSTAWGQTEITVTSGDISASVMLSTVDAMSVTELLLSVDNDQTTCAQGYTAQFRAHAVIGTEGMTFDVTDQVTFENVDAIGEIDGHGLFTGTTVGTASIKATYTAADYSGTEIDVESNEVEFEVTDAVVESIYITSSDGMTDFGEDAPQILNDNMSLTFTAYGRFSDGNELELDDVTWESSDTSIADIDGSTGVVTPVTTAWGQTRITATSASCAEPADIMLSTADAMAVTNLAIAVDGDLTQIAKGMTAQFRVYATIGTDSVTYEVTDQVYANNGWEGITSLGDIDEHGLFTATTVGATNVTATYREITSDPYDFEVIDAVVESIEITPANPMILNADTQQFTAKAILSDGTEIDPLDSADVAWSSSDEAICTIDDDGLATPAHGAFGQVIITATYTDPATSETYDAETTLSIASQATAAAVRMTAAYVPDTLSDDSVDCELTAKVIYTVSGSANERKATDIPVAADPSDPAQMTFTFNVAGDDPAIKSVTLYNKATGGEETGESYAFAWFDSQDGAAIVPDGETVLDETANTFAGGEGTESAPYLVANPRQLNNVNDYMSSHFLQICDIDFEGGTGLKVDSYEEIAELPGTPLPVIAKSTAYAPFYNNGAGWRPIGMDNATDFTGAYNGGGFEIRDLILNITTNEAAVLRGNVVCCGLFAFLSNAGLNNLKLADSCCFYANIPEGCGTRQEMGGFAARCYYSALADLENAASVVLFSTYPHAGGIAAYTVGSGSKPCSVTRCLNSGLVAIVTHNAVDHLEAGGIIGWDDRGTLVSECGNSGKIAVYSALSASAGGIAGTISQDTIQDCWNTGDIFVFVNTSSSSSNLSSGGGIAGTSEARYSGNPTTISNCWSSGAITATGNNYSTARCGGINGNNRSLQVTIANCFYLKQNGITKGVGNVGTDVEANTKGCTLAELENQSAISIDGTPAGYLNELLNVSDAVWSVNTKEDNALAPGLLKGFSVLTWQL